VIHLDAEFDVYMTLALMVLTYLSVGAQEGAKLALMLTRGYKGVDARQHTMSPVMSPFGEFCQTQSFSW
jgi:hypothetical protein